MNGRGFPFHRDFSLKGGLALAFMNDLSLSGRFAFPFMEELPFFRFPFAFLRGSTAHLQANGIESHIRPAQRWIDKLQYMSGAIGKSRYIHRAFQIDAAGSIAWQRQFIDQNARKINSHITERFGTRRIGIGQMCQGGTWHLNLLTKSQDIVRHPGIKAHPVIPQVRRSPIACFRITQQITRGGNGIRPK